MSASEKWLSVDQIADHLGVSKESIYRWLEREMLPAHRVGRLWKFKMAEIDAWVIRGGLDTTRIKSRMSPTVANNPTIISTNNAPEIA
jgi:excisionase family DNA binding protein